MKYKRLSVIFSIVFFTLLPEWAVADEFIGQSGEKIRAHIIRQKNIIITPRADDSLQMDCTEADELGQVYRVEYSFILKEDKCVAYTKAVPLQEYWGNWLNDYIETQEGKGLGDEWTVLEKRLFKEYQFEGFRLQLKATSSQLFMRFVDDCELKK